MCQLTVCQPYNLRRERWGLLLLLFGFETRGKWFEWCQTSTQKWHSFSCANPLSPTTSFFLSLHLTLALVVLWWVWRAQSMQPTRPSEVGAIIISLWCLVFVVWCPQSPPLFPIHSLHHPLVVSCGDCMVFTIELCGLLSVCQLTACQPHNLWRERWGLSCCGLKPGHV